MGLFDFFRRGREEPEEERVEVDIEPELEREVEVEPERIGEETVLYGPRGEEIGRVEILEEEEEAGPAIKTAQELREERLAELRGIAEERRAELERRRVEKEYEREFTTKGRIAGAAAGVAVGFARGVAGGAVDVRRGFRQKGVQPRGTAGRVQRAAYKAATLGGQVRLTKTRKHLYVPKTQPELYSAAGMKKLSMPALGKLRQITALGARRTGLPSVSPLAQAATRPSPQLAKPMGMARVGSSAQDMAMERLRGISFPRGLSQNEKLSYAEIRANHDIDTKSHVVSELMDMGVEKREAIQAIEELMKRKVVSRGTPFKGEPTLEIVR